jgi:hypothetical protein
MVDTSSRGRPADPYRYPSVHHSQHHHRQPPHPAGGSHRAGTIAATLKLNQGNVETAIIDCFIDTFDHDLLGFNACAIRIAESPFC